jgi:autotransporter-associated beta strand protein
MKKHSFQPSSVAIAFRLIVALACCVMAGATAHAADVTKANNTTALNVAGSWATAVPGTGDVAVWDSTVTGANSSALGGNLSWQGIRIANPAGAITVTGTTATTLTLGTAGIDMSAATQNLTLTGPAMALSGTQNWSVATGRTLTLGALAAPTALNLGGFTLNSNATGTGSITITSGYTISNGTIAVGGTGFTQIQSGGSRTTTINSDVAISIASGARLNFGINSAAASGVLALSSAAPITVNGGTLGINTSGSTGTNFLTQTGKISLNNGSTLNNNAGFGYFSNLNGEIAIAGSVTWLEAGGSTANTSVAGSLTGSGTLAFQNTATARTTVFSGDNSGFTGTVNLNGASGNRTLRLTTATAGSASATWAPAASNTLQVDGVAVNLGTLNGAGTVTNSHATNVVAITVGSGAFSGAITNGTPLLGMAVTKTGSGTLAFTGANTYTGLTDIQGGTLSTTTLQTGGGAVSVGNSGTFALTQSANGSTFNISTLTLGSTGGSNLILTGAAAPSVALITAPNFTVNGASTITLKGTPVNNMTLIDYTGSIGGGGFGGLSLVLPFRTSGTLFNDTTNTLVQLTSFAADTLKWQGNLSSAWDIDTTNGGVLGTANFKTTAAPSGARYVEAGVGFIDSPVFDDTATGSTAVTLGTTVTPAGVTFNNSTLAYSVSGAGAIEGATSIVKNGSAALTLATNNTFSGGVQLNAGTLNVNNAGALGTGTLTIAAGTTVDNTSGSAVVATNAQNWNGDFTFTGSSNLTLGNAAMNASRQVTVNGSTLAVGGISGTGFGLTKAGAGTLAVGASTYTGATTVNAGTLRSTSATAFSNSSSVTLANTTGVALDLNGINQTINTITGGGATGGNIVLNGAVLTTGTASNNTFAGALTGAGGLTKVGAGTLTLTGDKTGYTGTTTVSAGTLDLGTINGTFGTGLITVGGGLFVQGNGLLTIGISGGSAGFGARGGNLTVNVGGAGASIALNSGGSGGTGGMIFGSATSDSKVIVQNSISINNTNGSRTVTVNTGTGTASAEISGVITSTTIGNIAKSGAGDLILSAANTYSGETAINAGRIVLGNNLALQNSPINTDNVGKIDATGFTTPTFGGLKGSADLSTMITGGYSGITSLTLNTVNTDAQLTAAGKTFTSFGGVISDGAVGMSVTKTGVGTQTLTNSNTYTGNTVISNGTLQAGIATAIPSGSGNGNVVLDGGASVAGVLDLNGFDVGINGLSGVTGTVLGKVVNNSTGTNKTLTVGNGNATGTTFVGIIANNTSGSGTVALNKTGTGTQTLSSAAGNSYSGGTTVSAGTLLANNTSGSATGTGSVSVASTATLGGVGFLTPGANNSVDVTGTVSVGLSSAGAGNLAITTSGTGALTFNTGSALAFDLALYNAGDNTGTAAAADVLKITGTVNLASLTSFTLVNSTGTASTAFAAGDSWKLFDWSTVGTKTDPSNSPTDSSSSLYTLPTLTGGLNWNTSALFTTGVISVVNSVPEPSRAVLLLLGFSALFMRRRRP